MKILGIESSCDDTSISIIDNNKNIIANETISQNQIHKDYNGVVPELAARNHVLYIDKILKRILKKQQLRITDIGLIAATVGPGLIGGLLVGLTFAKTLSQVNRIPFIGVNHLEGHALTARLANKVEYPFLLLLVSGGHSNFYFISDINDYKFLGGTLDDALGEAFDKVANILGLDFPGGPQLELLAMKGDYKKVSLPKPLINVKSLDMSFSGLKTAVFNCKNEIDKNNISRCDLAASFQKSVADVLCKKISLAIDISNKEFSNYKNVVVSGGVAANNYLRKKIIENVKLKNKLVFFPPTDLCTDNGAMIAWAGYELYTAGVKSKLNVKAKPRWPLESIGERV